MQIIEDTSVVSRGSLDNPHLSIIVPSHRRPEICGRLIERLNVAVGVEIIVVENGNDEVSRAQYAKLEALPSVHLISSPVGHASKARNLGLSVATGDWVWFLDDDDIPGQNTMEKVRGLTLEPGGVDIFLLPYCYAEVDKWSKSESRCSPVKNPRNFVHSFEAYRKTAHFGNSSGCIVRRALVHSVDGWDEGLMCGQDADLFLRLAEKRPRYVGVDCDPVVRQIDTPNRITLAATRQWVGKFFFLRKNWGRLAWSRRIRYVIAIVFFIPFWRKIALKIPRKLLSVGPKGLAR